MYFCKECGAIVDDDDVYCRKCGAKLNKTIVCPYCNADCIVTSDGIECPGCGYKQTMDEAIDEFMTSLKNLDDDTLDKINTLLDDKLEKMKEDKSENINVEKEKLN